MYVNRKWIIEELRLRQAIRIRHTYLCHPNITLLILTGRHFIAAGFFFAENKPRRFVSENKKNTGKKREKQEENAGKTPECTLTLSYSTFGVFLFLSVREGQLGCSWWHSEPIIWIVITNAVFSIFWETYIAGLCSQSLVPSCIVRLETECFPNQVRPLHSEIYLWFGTTLSKERMHS